MSFNSWYLSNSLSARCHVQFLPSWNKYTQFNISAKGIRLGDGQVMVDSAPLVASLANSIGISFAPELRFVIQYFCTALTPNVLSALVFVRGSICMAYNFFFKKSEVQCNPNQPLGFKTPKLSFIPSVIDLNWIKRKKGILSPYAIRREELVDSCQAEMEHLERGLKSNQFGSQFKPLLLFK